MLRHATKAESVRRHDNEKSHYLFVINNKCVQVCDDATSALFLRVDSTVDFSASKSQERMKNAFRLLLYWLSNQTTHTRTHTAHNSRHIIITPMCGYFFHRNGNSLKLCVSKETIPIDSVSLGRAAEVHILHYYYSHHTSNSILFTLKTLLIFLFLSLSFARSLSSSLCALHEPLSSALLPSNMNGSRYR